ncbi:MAG TPA: MarR family transcriptional regulator [Marmoricola sp.]|nr:MarR family transcriptional regulator [Marmoricola sp.]
MRGEEICSGRDGRPPLSVLLGRAEALFLTDFEHRIAASDFAGLSLAHSANVLRFLDAGPQRASQFVGECGVSKQAVSQQIAQLEKQGYISSVPDPLDQRARILALTDRGVEAQAFVHRVFAEVEASWAERLGTEDSAALRRVLERVITA